MNYTFKYNTVTHVLTMFLKCSIRAFLLTRHKNCQIFQAFFVCFNLDDSENILQYYIRYRNADIQKNMLSLCTQSLVRAAFAETVASVQRSMEAVSLLHC